MVFSADANAAQNIAARQLALNQQKEKLDLITEEVRVSLCCLNVGMCILTYCIVEMQLNKKLQDAENNNAQLNTLKTEMSTLARQCQQSHQTYLKKREEVLLLRATGGKPKAWNANDAWAKPTDTWGTTQAPAVIAAGSKAGTARYRALYEFVARNGDEISFQPGDIIIVSLKITSSFNLYVRMMLELVPGDGGSL